MVCVGLKGLEGTAALHEISRKLKKNDFIVL